MKKIIINKSPPSVPPRLRPRPHAQAARATPTPTPCPPPRSESSSSDPPRRLEELADVARDLDRDVCQAAQRVDRLGGDAERRARGEAELRRGDRLLPLLLLLLPLLGRRRRRDGRGSERLGRGVRRRRGLWSRRRRWRWSSCCCALSLDVVNVVDGERRRRRRRRRHSSSCFSSRSSSCFSVRSEIDGFFFHSLELDDRDLESVEKDLGRHLLFSFSRIFGLDEKVVDVNEIHTKKRERKKFPLPHPVFFLS